MSALERRKNLTCVNMLLNKRDTEKTFRLRQLARQSSVIFTAKPMEHRWYTRRFFCTNALATPDAQFDVALVSVCFPVVFHADATHCAVLSQMASKRVSLVIVLLAARYCSRQVIARPRVDTGTAGKRRCACGF